MSKVVSRGSGISCAGSPDRTIAVLLTVIAAGFILASLRLPLWQMRLEAPQYRGEEALRIAVHPNALRGDLRELTVLDQYIGVHVPPTLPQFQWLPGALVAGAVLGVGASLLGGSARRRVLIAAVAALTIALGAAAVQAKFQMHDIGHHREARTVLVGVRDFTPPFLGTTKIAQFEVSSRLGLGAWLIGAALILQLGAAANGKKPSLAGRTSQPTPAVGILPSAAANARS